MEIDPAARKLLDDFAQVLGLDALVFDEENAVSISVDDTIVLDLQLLDESEDLLLFTDFGPPENGPDTYPMLLKANLFWRATQGATFSITDDEPAHVVLTTALSWRHLDAEQLVFAFERFVHTVEDWREVLDQPEDVSETETDSNIDPRQGGMIRA